MSHSLDTTSLSRAVNGMIWCAVVLYVVFIFTMTHMPLDVVRDQAWFRYSNMYWLDKFIQCGVYSVLVGLLGCALFPLSRDPVSTIENLSGFRTIILFAVVIAVAVVDEQTQEMFGRNCEVLDMVADVTGIIPGFCLFLVLNEVRHRVLDGSI